MTYKIKLAAAVLLGAATLNTQASLVVNLGNGDDQQTSTVFTYSSLGTTPVFDDSNGIGAVLQGGGSLSGASGSFAITLTAIDVGDVSASSWNLTQGGAKFNTIVSGGLGVNGLMAGSNAIQMNINTDSLTLGPGQKLAFSWSATDANDSFRIYQRTGASTAAVVSENSDYISDFVDVGGLKEYAVADAGYHFGGGLRMDTFTVEVIPEPVTLGLISTAACGILFIRRLMM